mgnify:CR=1 FL=1
MLSSALPVVVRHALLEMAPCARREMAPCGSQEVHPQSVTAKAQYALVQGAMVSASWSEEWLMLMPMPMTSRATRK